MASTRARIALHQVQADESGGYTDKDRDSLETQRLYRDRQSMTGQDRTNKTDRDKDRQIDRQTDGHNQGVVITFDVPEGQTPVQGTTMPVVHNLRVWTDRARQNPLLALRQSTHRQTRQDRWRWKNSFGWYLDFRTHEFQRSDS